MKPQLPGLGPVATLMLVPVLAVWLGISGPADLQKWQTLMAALIALIAAGIAYKAAMAKVENDQDLAEREVLRRQLGLLLKVDLAIDDLHDEARRVWGSLMFISVSTSQLSVENLRISEPPELEEAWSSLDIFPPRTIQELRTIRSAIRKLSRHLSRIENESPWSITPNTPYLPPGKDDIHRWTSEIWQSCALVQYETAAVIRALAPRIGEDERDTAIFGEPVIPDEDDDYWQKDEADVAAPKHGAPRIPS
jgi:hypothetical protein